MRSLADIEQDIDAINPADTPLRAAQNYLALAEEVLVFWVTSREGEPTDDKKEGFRLLALHRQGAKGEPSFNACRETCRELIYRYNVVMNDETDKTAASMMTHLTRHLHLFVAGKMQVAGLGDFCCASKPIRTNPQELH